MTQPRMTDGSGDFVEGTAEDGDVEPGFAGGKGKAVIGEPYALLAAVVGVATVRPQPLSHEANLQLRAASVTTRGGGALARLERVLLLVGDGFDVDEE